MITKTFLFGLAALGLAACADPQVRPAPDTTTANPSKPAVQPQSVPAGNPGQPASNPGQPAGNPAQPAGNPAQPVAVDPAVRDRVMVLLNGIEHIATKDEFARAGTPDQVVAVLDALARDNGAKLRHRAGATAALGLYPRPDTRKTLESLITEPGLDEVLRRPAIKSYAAAFGAESVALVSKQLESANRSTRESALRALADVGTPPARQAIEARLKVEDDEALKKLGQETLARWK